MPYIGKAPDQGVRNKYKFTASGGETSLSGNDANGNSLVFNDGEYVDAYINGILLVHGSDYNTTTANTIAGLTALSAGDIVEIIVYDTFSVFNGEFISNINTPGIKINGTLVTATAAELNHCDGVTSSIQTQLNNAATTGKAIAMAIVFG